MAEFDLVVRGGTIADGTGAGTREADVALKDGRIAVAGSVAGKRAEEIAAIAALVAASLLPTAASAQSDDGAYCAQLSAMASRYLVAGTANGGGQPDLEVREAIVACQAGKYDRGIPVLERKLRANRFTLPKR